MTDYQQSLPGLQCREWFDQCIAASPNDIFGQEACKSVTCGNKTSEALTSSSSAAPSATPTATGGGGDKSSSPSATSASPSVAASSGAAVALGLAREYGTPALAAGLMAAFGLAL
jgi:hypothetical protein